MRQNHFAAVILAAFALNLTLHAGPINVPNFSFESPQAPTNLPYADTNLDDWQIMPQPSYFDPDTFGFPWAELMGEFYNVPFPGEFIDNCNRVQAAFIQYWPEAGIFQDYNSIDWTGNPPSHVFNALYKVGNAYQLTVGVVSGAPLAYGSTLILELYYRDASNNMVAVGETTVTNSAATFPTSTHLVDFSAVVPGVQALDAWAGQNIGIALLSGADTPGESGYWDMDNVRLTEIPTPSFVNPTWSNGVFSATLFTSAGGNYQILSTADLTKPVSEWSIVTTLFNVLGATPFTDTPSGGSQRFYIARERNLVTEEK